MNKTTFEFYKAWLMQQILSKIFKIVVLTFYNELCVNMYTENTVERNYLQSEMISKNRNVCKYQENFF